MADQAAPIVFDYRWRWRLTAGLVFLLGTIIAGLAAINSWRAALVILGVFAILTIVGIGFQVYRVAVVGDQLEVCRRSPAGAAARWPRWSGAPARTAPLLLRRGLQPTAVVLRTRAKDQT